MPNPLDQFFDGMESIVGGIEKSRDFAEVPTKDEDAIDAEVVEHRAVKPKLIWGHADGAYHIFEGFALGSVCGSSFEIAEVTERKTEMDGIKIVACGSCLKILHAKYRNA